MRAWLAKPENQNYFRDDQNAERSRDWQKEQDVYKRQDLTPETRSRIRHLIPVRDAVRDCLRSQMDGSGEDRVVETRQQLNLTYDRFVARFGPVNLRANQRAFDGDPCLLYTSGGQTAIAGVLHDPRHPRQHRNSTVHCEGQAD